MVDNGCTLVLFSISTPPLESHYIPSSSRMVILTLSLVEDVGDYFCFGNVSHRLIHRLKCEVTVHVLYPVSLVMTHCIVQL